MGLHFLWKLSIDGSYELFGNKLIKVVVKYIWGYYKFAIIKFIFVPYVIFFILFCLVTHLTQEDLIDTNAPVFSTDPVEIRKVRLGLEICMLPFIVYYLYI